jgi:hypothetical protein
MKSLYSTQIHANTLGFPQSIRVHYPPQGDESASGVWGG